MKTPAWRVEPVYVRILNNYGSPELLANAPQSALAAEIEPLGLHNKRATQLIEIAKSLLETYNGVVPRDASQLSQLPGVGPYIANAVICFAYEYPTGVVDSNIARVLTRFFTLEYSGRPAISRKVWQFAETLVPQSPIKAKQYNYALLDFAAEICTPKSKCFNCSISKMCDFSANI